MGALAAQTVIQKPVVPEGSGRWRGALANNSRDSGAATGDLGEHLSKKLAFMIQHELDEYCKGNSEFVVILVSFSECACCTDGIDGSEMLLAHPDPKVF